ncbi:MAG: 3-deoxy-manno-octulosonate cytidylyltransferase [Mariprofundaceae bacterium]
MRIIVGIPARYASSRFPGKPLALLQGKPMLHHVIDRALESDVGPVLVATDDESIFELAQTWGATAVLSQREHASGTERLAEAVEDMDCDIVVNVQGDEPLIDPEAIRAVLEPFKDDPCLPMATLAHPIRDDLYLHDPNVVKVVCNAASHAMYFSRSPVPYLRTKTCTPLQHVGLYAYRRRFLLHYPALEPCAAEQAENLEQLRVLHHGYTIAVTIGNYEFHGVDTPEDLERAEALLREQ